MSKFHVGQKIRVVNAKPASAWSHLNGKTGVVGVVHGRNEVHDVSVFFDDGTRHPDGVIDFGFKDDELEAVEDQLKPGLYLYYPGDGQAYGPYRIVAVDGDETWVKPVPSPGEHPDTPWGMGFVVKTNELKPLLPHHKLDKSGRVSTLRSGEGTWKSFTAMFGSAFRKSYPQQLGTERI